MHSIRQLNRLQPFTLSALYHFPFLFGPVNNNQTTMRHTEGEQQSACNFVSSSRYSFSIQLQLLSTLNIEISHPLAKQAYIGEIITFKTGEIIIAARFALFMYFCFVFAVTFVFVNILCAFVFLPISNIFTSNFSKCNLKKQTNKQQQFANILLITEANFYQNKLLHAISVQTGDKEA